MTDLFNIWRIGLYEAKLLFRSWGMRIFSLLGLLIITLLLLVIGTRLGHSPYYFHSFSGSLPLAGMKFYNIFQGIFAAFLASEFFKRDRRHDTTEVIYARSYPNSVYVMGKVSGIISVFTLLNLAALLITFIIHYFFSSTPFSLTPYILYPLLICLPTLVFVIGLTFMLVSLLRSQAVVFVLMLGISVLSLTLIGSRFFYLFDIYAFYQPLVFSDFIGMANMPDLLMLRGMYFLLGWGLISSAVLLSKRLRQSNINYFAHTVIATVCIVAALVLGINYNSGKLADRDYRQTLVETSQSLNELDSVSVKSCNLQLEFKEDLLNVKADLILTNRGDKPVDTLLLSLNPGLKIEEITGNGAAINNERDFHLIKIKPENPVQPGAEYNVSITYSGNIDERYCYLDVDQEVIEGNYRLWLYNVPKKYAFVYDDYLHLTPESGWYPIAGLPSGLEFPGPIHNDYSKYSLSVAVPDGLSAFSQGEPETKTEGGNRIYSFKPEQALTQLSLTVGDYEKMELKVDEVTYSVNVLKGHNYFSEKFNEIGEDITKLIRDSKNEYEVLLGINYPYKRLDLVETPIQFFSHQRVWTVVQESVQPQIVFLSEMGSINPGAEFRQYRWGGRGGRGREMSPKEIQTSLFNRFMRDNFLGTGGRRGSYIRGGGAGLRVQMDVQPFFEIFPNYYNFQTRLVSPRWPILDFSIEAYLRARVSDNQMMFMRMIRGLSDAEELNLTLQNNTLAQLITNAEIDFRTARAVLLAKGNQLLTSLEASLGADEFKNAVPGFINEHKYKNIEEAEFLDFLKSFNGEDQIEMIDSWYNNLAIPGYIVENMEAYQVIEGERKRTQLKLKISNPSNVDGLVKLSIRSRGGMGDRGGMRGMGGQSESDFSRAILIPAGITRDLAIMLDEAPAMMTLDTIVSQNIPSVFSNFFRQLPEKKDEKAEEYQIDTPYRETKLGENGEYIVDNEDAGFEVLSRIKENWLRRTLKRIFKSEESDNTYQGMNMWDPPSNWELVTNQDFYGKFMRSGHFKKSGDGSSKVAWKVNIAEDGEYDIYYYHIQSMMHMRFRGRGRDRNSSQGKMYFQIHFNGEIEEVEFDLANTENGWNLLGTFPLSAGENRIELNDKNDLPFVTADAVKWVKRK